MRSSNRRRVARLAGLAVAASAAVAFSMAGSADAIMPSCPNTITACGCTITTSGTYTVNKNLTAAAGTVCIEIGASNTVLEILNHSTITGTGKTGTGVLVDKGSDNSTVAGIKRVPSPFPQPTGIPTPGIGDEASIVNFDTGIEVDANNTVVEFFDHLNGNHTAGLLLNNVSNVTAGNFCANRNDGAGISATGTTGSRFYNFTAEKNGFDGALFNDSDGNSLYNFTTILNSEDGVLLQSSNSNALTTGSSQGNKVDGVRIGCDSSPSNPYNCDGGTSDHNHVTVLAVGQLSPFLAPADNCGETHTPRLIQVNGIEVEEGDGSNVIAGNLANYETDNTNFNLFDQNPACDNNSWNNNIYGKLTKVSPSCAGNP